MRAASSVSEQVRGLLNPTSIAVIGASESSVWATELVQNIWRWDFPGSVHMVHPTKRTVYGRPAYPTVADIPEPVDHALVVVRAALVPDVLRQCGERGIRSATVIAAGFSEAGEEGARLADELVAVSEEYGISVIGPNCYGFLNYPGRAIVTRNWVEEEPRAGGAISMIFQSGQLNLSACGSAFQRGIDLRYMVSSGNELVTSANDYFEYFVEDEGTRVLGGAIERIPDPRRFEKIALRALEVGKPIVLLKLGTSVVGSRIATSHTGAVAGVAEVVDTFLRELGVIQVHTIDELIETAGLLAERGWPRGARTVFLGGSGGAGEFYADMCQDTSIEFPSLSPATVGAIADLAQLPATALHNPMDLTASGFGNLATVAPLLADSGEVDVIVAQGEEPLSEELQGPDMVRLLGLHMEAMNEAAARGAFAVFASSADRAPTTFGKQTRRAHGSVYLRGKTGVQALSHAIDYSAHRETAMARVRTLINDRERHTGSATVPGGRFSEAAAKEVLAAAGIPTTVDISARTEEEALIAAAQIGYPVVVKIDSDAIAHKSEIGGVVLGVTGPDELRHARDGILARAKAAYPAADVERVLVCQQIDDATELIIGAVHDPAIGPVLLVGAGGVYVEILRDVALALPPVDRDTARTMLETLQTWPILAGARGRRPVAVEAVVDTVVAASKLIADLGERLVELDINPILATADGAWAADALLIVKEETK